MTDTMLDGLMMDDYPLSLTAVVERAELLSGSRKVVSRRPDGQIHRTTIGECAHRARRLGVGAHRPGARRGRSGRDADVEPARAPRGLLRDPIDGAVIHTLNPRLHPDELSFIATTPSDAAIIVDESLLEAFQGFRHAHEFKHVIVVSQGGRYRRGTLDYESLIATHEPMQWPDLERAARGGHVLHVGHDRPAQGRGLFPPRASAPLADGGAARHQQRLVAGHDPAGGADVPCQRLGPALHGHVRRRRAGAARARARRRAACSI